MSTRTRDRTKGSNRKAADVAFDVGQGMVQRHPLFAPLAHRAFFMRSQAGNPCGKHAWVCVTEDGYLWTHPTRVAPPTEWAYLLAHGLLYLGFGFFQRDRAFAREWNAACDVVIARFLRDMKFGTPPEDRRLPDDVPGWDEARWYREFCEHGVRDELAGIGPAGPDQPGMLLDDHARRARDRVVAGTPVRWEETFAEGLRCAVESAVATVADVPPTGNAAQLGPSLRRARSWFMSSFPLLASLVASFDLIEDADVCRLADIRVAAVSETTHEIYLNPTAGLTEMELRFVLAHEVLHVGLRHGARCLGRDPYLWNIACDFVINGWLIEMGVGTPPALGMLHDPSLAGLSSEAVYDRIVVDLRRYRKLLTFAGAQCDVLERAPASPQATTDLDAFYRGQLAKGLALHEQVGRGLLPAGLVEAIRALAQPPIEWDVQLARWFDAMFPPIEPVRTYARASRRQSATPDIPRPSRYWREEQRDGRVFGVVLDTSGSMDRMLVGKALGAIASYSAAREVSAARVVFCDARAYDAGYLAPHEIAGRVQVRGRGGTTLQPGIDLLVHAKDFPKDGPVLVITDGQCDRLSIPRRHAFLMPAAKSLPFVPVGSVYRMR